MLKFALLASGSKGNCAIIKDETASIIIDCGSTKKYLNECFHRLHYDYLNSDALFITHTHKDHIAQLKMFDSIATYSRSKLDTHHFHLLAPFEEVTIQSLKVKEIPLSHDCDCTSGFIIESQGRKLVYVTDTGYVKEDYHPLMSNADYYIFESNHDVEMLMNTRRPIYVKQRILGDKGHLCNEDSAQLLSSLIGNNTKEIVLAHISQEGNERSRAKEVLLNHLHHKKVDTDSIRIHAAGQFEIVIGGDR